MKKKIKIALITGIAGQDGAYLASFLIKKKYKIIGTEKANNNKEKFWRLRRLNIYNKIQLIKLNLNSVSQIYKVLKKNYIDEIYNLASLSHVGFSFKFPLKSLCINGIVPIKILEAIKNINPKIKFYQASSSEMFGNSSMKKQNEKTYFDPLSPYAYSKTLAHSFVKFYRETHSLFAVSGILFNHESPLRGKEFVTKKIVNGLAKISLGYNHVIELGNIYTLRDWGYAKDYVKVMWKMLQQNKAEDFVISTGKNHTIKDFINECIQNLKIKAFWTGKNLNERLVDCYTGKTLVKINFKNFRRSDIYCSKGDSSNAKKKLNWKSKTNFKRLVKIMVESELKDIKYGGHGKN